MKIAILGDHPYAQVCFDYLKSIGANAQRFSHDSSHKKALRVQKRFFSLNDGDAKQRFSDLFRVTFEQDPEKEITKQLEGEGKEVFEKLTSFELDYLKSRFEGYEDFDLVINLDVHAKAGTSGLYCVGEAQIEKIHYYSQSNASSIEGFLNDPKVYEIAIVGEEIENEALEKIEQWLLDGAGSKRVFGITSETLPLSKYSFSRLAEFEKTRVSEFERKLGEWQALEDYEKVKVPMPGEPLPCWVYFAGHELSVISKLSDQDRLFLTCEMSPHKIINEGRGEQNSKYPLKTIAVDSLIVAKGFTNNRQAIAGLRAPVTQASELENKEFEPGLLEIDIDSIKSEEQLIEFLNSCVNYYFVESE